MPHALESLDREAVKETLDVQLTTLRIIYGAQAAGVVFFGGFVLFMLMSAEPAEAGKSTLKMLSMIHGFVALSCAVAGTVMFNTLLSRQKIEAAMGENAKGGESTLFDAVQTAYIVRNAVYEGAALLGLAVCFLGASTGELISEPMYRLNFISPVLYLLFAGFTFPTRGKLGRLVGDLMGIGALY